MQPAPTMPRGAGNPRRAGVRRYYSGPMIAHPAFAHDESSCPAVPARCRRAARARRPDRPDVPPGAARPGVQVLGIADCRRMRCARTSRAWAGLDDHAALLDEGGGRGPARRTWRRPWRWWPPGGGRRRRAPARWCTPSSTSSPPPPAKHVVTSPSRPTFCGPLWPSHSARSSRRRTSLAFGDQPALICDPSTGRAPAGFRSSPPGAATSGCRTSPRARPRRCGATTA